MGCIHGCGESSRRLGACKHVHCGCALDIVPRHRATGVEEVLRRHVQGWKKVKGKKIERQAYSRLLVVRINWKTPMMGQASTVVATVHMHRCTAKGKQGFRDAHQTFFKAVQKACVRHNVTILTGDWNMALWQVSGRLGTPCDVAPAVSVKLAAFYAWLQASDMQENEEEDDDDDDDPRQAAADAASSGQQRVESIRRREDMHARVRCDSCGIFIVGEGWRIKLALTDENLKTGRKLRVFQNGQGYPMGSYGGGMREAERTLKITLDASAAAEKVAQDHVKGKYQGKDKGSDKGKGKGKAKDTGKDAGLAATSWTGTVVVKHKLSNVDMFDPSGRLFTGGSHMPLLCYIGNISRRSVAAVERRETESTRRGWGPTSAKRSWLMQSQGFGPRPSEARRIESEEQDTWTPADAGGWSKGHYGWARDGWARDGWAPAGAGWRTAEPHGGWGSSSSSWWQCQ